MRLYAIAPTCILVLESLGGCGTPLGVRVDCSVQGNRLGADLTPPVVRGTTPRDSTTVSGLVTLTLTARDDCGVSRVWFGVFNNTVGADFDSLGSVSYPVTRAANGVTYTTVWDTRKLPNGSYGIGAFAEDNHLPGGNVGEAGLNRLLVSN